jgi:hypothetical protein
VITEPIARLGAGEVKMLQRPVDDRVGRVEDPRPTHQAERQRRRPREQDQEPQDPLAGELLQERVRQQAGDDEHDGLRDDREEEGVPDGVLERRV